MCRAFCRTAAKLQYLLYFKRLVRAGTGVTSPGILVSLEKFEDEFEEKLEVKMPLGWGRQGETPLLGSSSWEDAPSHCDDLLNGDDGSECSKYSMTTGDRRNWIRISESIWPQKQGYAY